MAWAPAKPADSKPSPLNRVFASTIFSTASVHTPASRAILAFKPSSKSVSRHSLAKAIAASVVLPPAQEIAPLALHALASKYVAKASPMPATVNLTGDFDITSVSIITISGFFGRNRYWSKTPSSVYKTDRALHGASVDAIVGHTTTGLPV